MTKETEDFLREAIDKSISALNECAAVFVELARVGRYPQQLQGRGWEFITHARAALKSAATRAGLYGTEDDLTNEYVFGNDDKRPL
jgi:hypothetical protein